MNLVINKKTTQRLGQISCLVLSLSACEHLGPDLGIKLPIEPVETLSEQPLQGQTHTNATTLDDNSAIYSQLSNSQTADSITTTTIFEEFPGTGQFISPSSRSDKQPKAEQGKYTLNFDEADLGEVTKIILSDMLGENYVLSPRAGGKVTLQTTRPLTKAELLPTLEMILRMNGVVIFKEAGVYRVEPNAQALNAGASPKVGYAGKKLPAGYQVKIIPLRYVGVNDMTEILTPLMPAKAILRIDHARNLMMVAGTGRELEQILETVRTFDVNIMQGMSFGLFPLETLDVGDAITELEKVFSEGEKNPLAGILKFIPIERLNALIVVTHQPVYLQEVKKWLKRLDKAESLATSGATVYRVQHLDAVKLAETLNEILGKASSSSTKRVSIAPGSRTAKVTNKNKATTITAQKSNRKTGSGLNSLENVSIIADESNNALIILANPQEYKTVAGIIKQLDVMPLQVLIDAQVIAVSLTDDLKYGVQWKFNNGLGGGNEGIGILSAAKSAALAATFPGFSYVVSGSNGVKAVIDMLASKNKINVLSSPSLMVLNNQEAMIKVGDQVPIRTSESTNTNASINPIVTSNIEMRDTGVTLTVKPRVNANGVVIMDIEQSVDSIAPTQFSSIDSPTIQQRQIKTSVAVINGETIVLGGLISEDHTYTKSGIPFLYDLPWIGSLFGTTTKIKKRNELIVMITPRVIQNKVDARLIANEFKRKLTGIYEELPDLKLENTEIK